nr:ATP-dependent helicase [Desulfobulbaceae bacterium]
MRQENLFHPHTPPDSSHSDIIRNSLNKPQYEAVTTTDGPVLVIAGAGSGKTRTLVYRVAHLIEKGVSPEKILLLTFTRKSAHEMLNRASQLWDSSCQKVTGGTFHGVASSLLRRYGFHLGYTPQFTILDRSDSEGIINLLKSSLELSGVGKRFPSKKVIINIFGQSVNKRKSLVDIIDSRYWHLSEFIDDLDRIQRHYAKFKLEHNLMDYDDLLVNFEKILRLPEASREISAKFSHIMVDEYQDTNIIQAEIVRLLSSPHGNVMVVGDDSQSIYSFRGADFKNIMQFPELFEGTKLIRLEENYRSTQPILDMTNGIIANAQEKYTKELYTNVEGGKKPICYSARNDSDQAHYIASTIDTLVSEGTPLNEIAVLFRSGFHSYKLELELSNRQLHFEKRGGLKLTESAHIKDVLSYLRVLYNPQDNLSWNRILLLLEKVGPKTAQNVLNYLKKSDAPLKAIGTYKAGGTWQKGLDDLVLALTNIQLKETPVQQFDEVMLYYQDIFERIYHDDYPNRSRDLEQVREIIATYNDLESFIQDTALDPPSLSAHDNPIDPEANLVLSTVHSAKGLEWDTVFVMHLVEGKFPSSMAQTNEELEEERRLLYVASTRARKTLYLTYPREVPQHGRFAEPAIVSRFVEELPPNLLNRVNPGPVLPSSFSHKPRLKEPLRQSIRSDKDTLEGRSVRHPIFGEGRVLGTVAPRTVQISFLRHGIKTINLDYAKMEIVEE